MCVLIAHIEVGSTMIF